MNRATSEGFLSLEEPTLAFGQSVVQGYTAARWSGGLSTGAEVRGCHRGGRCPRACRPEDTLRSRRLMGRESPKPVGRTSPGSRHLACAESPEKMVCPGAS